MLNLMDYYLHKIYTNKYYDIKERMLDKEIIFGKFY
jgi:hypothetical protein